MNKKILQVRQYSYVKKADTIERRERQLDN